jgi:hypothetical protein
MMFGFPRCVGCSRYTWRACQVQREEPWYSLGEGLSEACYSHSMVAGGLLVMSSTTRFT